MSTSTTTYIAGRYYDPNNVKTRVYPLVRTHEHVGTVWGGLEFRGLYAQDVVPDEVPLNFTGIKNINPPASSSRMYTPQPKWDPVKAGIPIMDTSTMPRKFCPIL